LHEQLKLTSNSCAPIVSTLEVVFGIDPRAATIKPNKFNQLKSLSESLKAIFRIGVTVIIVLLAILVPTFELISAIMGAAFCFLICIVLPVVFHLKMFSGHIPKRQLVLDWALILVSVVLGIAGTVSEFLPRDWMGI
jgi:vesicular inhibitory amino acid transporter